MEQAKGRENIPSRLMERPSDRKEFAMLPTQSKGRGNLNMAGSAWLVAVEMKGFDHSCDHVWCGRYWIGISLEELPLSWQEMVMVWAGLHIRGRKWPGKRPRVVELDSGLNVKSNRNSIQNDSYKFSLEQLGGSEGDEKDQRPQPSQLQLTNAKPTSCLLHAHPATLQLCVSLGHGKLWKDRIHHLHCFYFLWYFISWHQERK